MFKIITNKKYKALLKEIEYLRTISSARQKFEIENKKIIVLRAEREFKGCEILPWFEIERIRNSLFYEILNEIKKEELFISPKVEPLPRPGHPERMIVEICVVTPNRK